MIRKIRTVARLDAIFTAPPSKAHTLRALFISSLAHGKSTLRNALNADDQKTAAASLESFGAKISYNGKDYSVTGIGGKPVSSGKVFAKDSGVTARFIIPYAGIAHGNTIVDGSQRLRQRPVKDLLGALEKTGFRYEAREKKLPVKVFGGTFEGGTTTVKGSASSQFLSALLITAPLTKNGLRVGVMGRLRSSPYIDLTLECMRAFGVSVKNNSYREFFAEPKSYSAADYGIEGDYSSASYFFAAAAITRGKARVDNLNPGSRQGDKFFLKCLERMGCKALYGRNFVQVIGGSLNGIRADMGNYPDIVPTLAVVAAFAKGKTTITNISHLALKESNRIRSTASGLEKCGIRTRVSRDSLEVFGGKPRGATIDPHNDHRIAMSFSVMGLAIPGMQITDSEAVSKSFANFYDELEKAYVSKPRRIILIGFRGTGKTSIGKRLAKRLNMPFIDTDREIEKKTGKSISQIFSEKGEAGFREIERKAIERLRSRQNACIACGGGAVLLEGNIESLKKDSIVILLEADPETIFARIRHDMKRPSLTKKNGLGEVLHLLDERKEKYAKAADMKISTSGKGIVECVQEIIDRLNARGLL